MMMEKYNPMYYQTFKHLFGSTKNKSLTISFLRDITGRDLVDIDLLPTELDKDDYENRNLIDVLCRMADGSKILIEMQRNVPKKRILCYAARIFSSQLPIGSSDFEGLIKETIVITITDFIVFPERTKFFSRYQLQEVETHDSDFEYLTLYVVELPKVEVSVEQLQTSMDAWWFFLKFGHTMNYDARTLLEKFEPMKEAICALYSFSLPKDEHDKYVLHEMANGTSKAQEEYRKKLIQQSIQQGIQHSKVEIAKRLLAHGMEPDKVADLLKIPKEDFI